MRLGRFLLTLVRCLHPFTWCVTLLATVAMVLITVAGQFVDALRQEIVTPWHQQCRDLYQANYDRLPKLNPDGSRAFRAVHVYEHGWPRPYLARAVASVYVPSGWTWSTPKIQFASPDLMWGQTRCAVSWSNYDNWPLAADDLILRPGALVLDGLLALTIVVVLGAAAQWWVRRRVGWLSFRLADLMVAVTVACLLLGWYQHHSRLRYFEEREATSELAIAFETRGSQMTLGRRYFGPDWLRRLTGSEYMLPFLFHVNSAAMVRNGDRWRECIETLPQLPYLEEVRMSRPMPLEALSYLERCPNLERLGLTLRHSSTPLTGALATQPLFEVEDLPKLSSLHLTELSLGGDSILAEDLEQILGRESLRRLELYSPSVTMAEIEAIRSRHPQLTLTVSWYYNQFPYPTPPPDHDESVAKVRLSRPAICANEPMPASP